jgi:hypothetical protein
MDAWLNPRLASWRCVLEMQGLARADEQQPRQQLGKINRRADKASGFLTEVEQDGAELGGAARLCVLERLI